MRRIIAMRPLLLLVFLPLTLLGVTPVAAQQTTPEPARIDIIPMEVAHLPGDASADPMQVDAFSRNNLAVANGYAYIVSGESGVRLVDVRDPFAPKHVTWVKPKSTYEALTVAVAGNHLYLGQQSSFTIFDLSDPAAPVETGSAGMTGHSGFVSANKDLVVVGMGPKLYVYRAGESDPSKYVAAYDFDPSSALTVRLANGSSLTVADAAQNAVIDQTRNLAVVTYDNGKAAVVDMTTPEAPRTLSYFAGPLGGSDIHAPGLYAVDGRIFVDYFTWLKVYEVAEDGSLNLVGQHGADGYSSGYHTTVEPRGMEVADGLAYIADYRNGLYVMDVHNPQKMYVRGYANPGELWWAADVEAEGDIVYLSSPQGGLRVYQLNGLGAPPAHIPAPPTATPQPSCTLTACTPTSVLYAFEFDAKAPLVQGCFVHVKASPDELLGGSARMASLLDPLREIPFLGVFVDFHPVIMGEKWTVELIKVREGKQPLSDVAWIMLVDLAQEAGGKYVGEVLEFRGKKILKSEAAQDLIVGPSLNLIEKWLSERGVDLLRWYEAWKKWPYASMAHRVYNGKQLEEFSNYDDLLEKYPEAYNYLIETEVWQCSEAAPAAQPAPASGSLAGQIVFLSSRDYHDFKADMLADLRPHDIYAMNPDGSGQRRITSGLRLYNTNRPVVSPDGLHIAVGGNGSLRVFGADGALEKTISIPTQGGWALDWFGENQLLYLAFDSGGDEIFTVDLATDKFTPLTDNGLHNLFAAWSPDGKKIAYMSDYQLWMMNADGSKQHQLLHGEARDLDWSADGSQIVFERQSSPNTPGYDFDLWIVDADGTNLRRLTDVPSMNIWDPSWSPDAQQVAYYAVPAGQNSADGQIYVTDSATGQTIQLTSDGNNMAPFWSAAAAPSLDLTGKILFFSDRDLLDKAGKNHMGPQALYVMGSDGGNQTRLSGELPYFTGEQAALSPDATQYAVGGSAGMITFYSLAGEKLRTMAAPTKSVWVQGFAPDGLLLVAGQEEGGSSGTRRALYLLDPTSSAARQFTDDAVKSWFGALSPDGKTLAYQVDPENATWSAEVWAMDITGENKRLLADRNGYMMAWSPDGKQLAFESYTNPDDGSDTQYDIFLVNADGSNLRNLTQGRSECNYSPSWSPDGKQIAFAANQGRGGAPTQVYVLDVATGETRQLTTAGSNQIPWWVKTTTAPAATPTPTPESRVAVGSELFDQKQASIERLSELPIKFLYDLATYPSGFGYDEQRAQDALDLVRKEYDAGVLSPERASAFYRLALEEEAQEKLYELAMQSTTDMADSTLAVVTLALSTVDTLNKTAAPIIARGGLKGKALERLVAEMSARVLDIAEYPTDKLIDQLPEEWDPEVIRSARDEAYDAIKLRLQDDSAPAEILADAAIKGPFAAALLKTYVIQTQPHIYEATEHTFLPDPLQMHGSDERARVYATGHGGFVDQAKIRTDLTHSLYEDFDEALDRAKFAAAIGDFAALVPGSGPWVIGLANFARVLGAASGGCGIWEGLANTDYLIDWSAEMHKYIYTPEGALPTAEHPIRTGGCSDLWISALGQRSRGAGLGASLHFEVTPPVENDTMTLALEAVALVAAYGDAETFARAVESLMTVDEANLAAMKGHVASLAPAQREQVDRQRLAFEADMIAVYAYAVGIVAGSDDSALRDGLKAEVERAQRSLAEYREVVRSQVGSLPAAPAAPVAEAAPIVDSSVELAPLSSQEPTGDSVAGLSDSVPLIAAIAFGTASVLSALVLVRRRRVAQ